MKTSEALGPAIGVIVGLGIIIGFYTLGSRDGKNTEKAEAIRAGVARYEVNPQTGETKFVYVKP